MDDGLAVVRRGEEEGLLQQLNDGHESIKFTCECEENRRISFLDIEFKREASGIRMRVFRKTTTTDRY